MNENESLLNSLLNERDRLNDRIEQIQREEKATAIASIRALMRDHRVTLSDLGGAKRRLPVGAPKYRDPATGKTWTGRGRPPRWFSAGRMEHIAA